MNKSLAKYKSLVLTPKGRDKQLKELYLRVKNRESFRLVGQSGIGKSTMLFWCYRHADFERAVIFSCNDSRKEIFLLIAEQLQIPDFKKKSAEVLQREILSSDEECVLFIDDVHKIKPLMIDFLRSLPSWTKFYSGQNKLREELKPLVWGVRKVVISRIDNQASLQVAEQARESTGNKCDITAVCSQGKGVPGRIWACVRGEVLREDEYLETEELNLFPFLFALMILALFVMRYGGRAAGSTEFYLIGGIGMGLAFILRIFAAK